MTWIKSTNTSNPPVNLSMAIYVRPCRETMFSIGFGSCMWTYGKLEELEADLSRIYEVLWPEVKP